MATTNINPIRVVVVEDKVAFRRGLGAIFELTPGIECVGMYATGEEALREIPKAAPDVVLMDLNLPGMSGIECTRELKRLRPSSQVLVLTYLRRIYEKLQVHSQAEAVAKFLR